MRSVHPNGLRDMLASAGGAFASGGSGRSELFGRFASLKAALPPSLARRLPSDVPSLMLLVAYAGTVVFAIGWIVSANGDRDQLPLTFLAAVYLAAGLAGLWFQSNLAVVVPATVLWLLLAVPQLDPSHFNLLGAVVFGAFATAGVVVVVRSLGRERSLAQTASGRLNRLGWDLFQISSQIPDTHEATPEVRIYSRLRVGELERHFDQVTSAAIQGGMRHAFRITGRTTSLHGVPAGTYDTESFSRLGGGGMSSVDLGLTGTTADELSGEAFIAVFEQGGDGSVDTIRAVVPSERQVRAYVGQVFAYWSSLVGPGSAADVMIRRYSGAVTQAVSSESSYVGDRLNAILRLSAASRPEVTLIGQPLDDHAVLVGAIRFGDGGPLYQLFPIALMRALVALIECRPLPPQPPAGLPPAQDSAEDVQAPPAREVVGSNGHAPGLQIKTIGGLRITAGGEDLTRALLDRKVLAFLWLHLLARTLRNPGDSTSRASLADELSPGLDASAQKSRLRGRLSELRNELPAAIGQRVKLDGQRVAFDTTDCSIDFRELADAQRTFAGANAVLSASELSSVEALAEKAHGEFLTEWDDIERHVNSGRSGAGEVVNELRMRTSATTASLLRILGTGYLAHGNAEAAVGPLERALAMVPDDEAVARTLAKACAQTGRLSRADELRKDFSLV